MLLLSRRQPRSGATLVESAIIYSAAFTLLFGLVIGGLGIFRYQEVAHLAREGARYASTHGGKYTEDGQPTKTGVSAITSSSDLKTSASSPSAPRTRSSSWPAYGRSGCARRRGTSARQRCRLFASLACAMTHR